MKRWDIFRIPNIVMYLGFFGTAVVAVLIATGFSTCR
jgi:hypothetical protein